MEPVSSCDNLFSAFSEGIHDQLPRSGFNCLVEELKNEGVTILDEIEVFEYGKFVHILDAEGNKVELWEPNDIEYDQIVGGRTK